MSSRVKTSRRIRLGVGDDPADAQPRRHGLRGGTDAQHPPPLGERKERGGGRAVEVEAGVGVVLDDHRAVTSSEGGERLAAVERERGAARVVVARDDVDQLRAGALGGRALEGGLERVDAQAGGVLRHVDDANAARAEGADRAGVCRRPDDDDVARTEERCGDVVDGVRAARAERDVLRAKRAERGPAGSGLARGDAGAQRRVALRPAVRERARRVGAQRGLDGRGELRDGQRCGVGHAGVEVEGQRGQRSRLRERADERPEQPLEAGL